MSLLPLALSLALGAGAASRPNVVLIDVCSLRADRLGAYGAKTKDTPRIDALAAAGVTFENALAQGSWCLPNYATLFTGLPPERHGLYVNSPRPLPPGTPTLAQTLKKAGYDTAAYSGGVYMLPDWGLDRGFDHYVNSFSTAHAGRPQGPASAQLPDIASWLARRPGASKDGGKPFFVYVAVDDLHAPLQPSGPVEDPGYRGVALDTRTWTVPFARAYSGEAAGWSPELGPLAEAFKADPRALAHLSKRYDAALRDVDAGVGALLEALARSSDTIVLFTADHGESLGEHGLLGHTQGLYEPTLRVPLIVLKPGRPDLAGRRVKALVERADLMPTVLDWAGAPLPGLPGRSIDPLLSDPASPWRRYAFASSRRNLAGNDGSDLSIDERAVRDERWKLLWTLDKGYALYDLLEDPGETRDLAAARPEVVARLSAALLDWVERSRPHAAGRDAGSPGVILDAAPRR